MEIVNKRKRKENFGSIKEGEVFLKDEEYVWMKIESTYGNDNGDYENVVYLADGSLGFLHDDEMVILVRCKLVIE